MKFSSLADFVLMFSLFIAMEALRKLHALGQPLPGLIAEATFAAAVFALFNWVRKVETTESSLAGSMSVAWYQY